MTALSLLDDLKDVMRLQSARIQAMGVNIPPARKIVESAALRFVTTHHAERAVMSKRLEAAERDAARWRHARKLLTVDDIEGAQGSYDSFGRLVSENECKRADDAIDAATQEGEG